MQKLMRIKSPRKQNTWHCHSALGPWPLWKSGYNRYLPIKCLFSRSNIKKNMLEAKMPESKWCVWTSLKEARGMKQCMEGGAWLSNSHSAVRDGYLCWITLILMTNMYGRPDCIFKMQCGGTQKRIKIGICTQPDTYYDVSKKIVGTWWISDTTWIYINNWLHGTYIQFGSSNWNKEVTEGKKSSGQAKYNYKHKKLEKKKILLELWLYPWKWKKSWLWVLTHAFLLQMKMGMSPFSFFL